MEIEILEETENPMLHRRDVTFRVTHEDATPERLSVRDSLAAQLGKDAEEVVIRELSTKFGMRETVGEAKVYDEQSYATEIEREYVLERNKIRPGHEEDAQEEAEEA